MPSRFLQELPNASSSSTAAWARRSTPANLVGGDGLLRLRKLHRHPGQDRGRTSSRTSTRTTSKAGADVVETDTFGANKLVLGEFDLTAAVLRTCTKPRRRWRGRRATSTRTSDKPRFVAGSMGPGTKLITLGEHDVGGDVRFVSASSAAGMIAGGVDCFMIETCQDLLQVKCTIDASSRALDEAGKPTRGHSRSCAAVTIETTGTMLLGFVDRGGRGDARASIPSPRWASTAPPARPRWPSTSLARQELGNVRGRKTLNGEERHVSVMPNAGLARAAWRARPSTR